MVDGWRFFAFEGERAELITLKERDWYWKEGVWGAIGIGLGVLGWFDE